MSDTPGCDCRFCRVGRLGTLLEGLARAAPGARLNKVQRALAEEGLGVLAELLEQVAMLSAEGPAAGERLH